MPKKIKKKPKHLKPFLGSALLCDNVTVSEKNRVNIQGVITIFWAWGYPCSRTWWFVPTLFDLPKGKISLTISLRKATRRELSSLTVVDANIEKDNTITAIPTQLTHSFESSGRYELICTMNKCLKPLKVPFCVQEKKWAKFTKDEKNFISKNPHVPHALKANIHCKQCSHAFIFEEAVIEENPVGGVLRFPESGEFECGECGYILKIKDYQGRLRASLKEIVVNAMRRKA